MTPAIASLYREFTRRLSPARRRRDRELRVLAAQGASSPAAEQFRLLALNLVTMLERSTHKTVAIFSGGHGDGRSTVALSLSYALARHSDVFLISGKWDQPQLRRIGWTAPIHDLTLVGDEQALITSDEQTRILDRIGYTPGQYVVLDAPPAGASADAFLIAQRAHNVVYVLPGQTTDLGPHLRNIRQLRRLNAEVLGVVINGD